MGFLIDHWDFSTTPASQPDNNFQTIKANHWYHCERHHPDIRTWLLENQVPLSTVNHLLADETRPSFHRYDDDSFMLILRGVNMNENAVPEDMLSIRILYFNGTLISTRKTSSKAISEIREALVEQKGPAAIADLLLAIVDGLTGKMQHYLLDIEEQIEQFELDTDQIGDIIEVQKALLRIKRFIRPQQYAIADFAMAELGLLEKKQLMLNYALSNITRINETIDFFLGELALLKEQIQQLREDKISRNSYLFTLIASIFLPTSFLTGLLGINIGGIPGVESPLAFLWFCIGLVVIFAAEVLLLKRLKFW
ncbi:Mg2+ and Co2+ transporter [Vibrio vulnificus YJ016]|uniref:Mg2+ and Co2+ transporter n=2 Tax=Vibrio vulnificus TaxID=672 RepID=Q7MI90_VIBVY|nr:zinc transporter ZntB [Vibrio vulnificus]AIL71421.1 Mg2+ and Co2+ transporter [Vibrio vulnificus]ANN25696.1 Magnesium and cobalt transport protein CorA [Vibrio vulnificus]EHH0748434.1 zinc transporter ZntB [Vibrio vulnificus]EHT4940358.1 zinc transporter ZntB [Vibrio vulnificus]EID4388182.1 zinc transporter ZntB [Vibrio vulnificus]